jgi:hypothetical protein
VGDAAPEGGGLPRYVERELATYLRCGILAHARVSAGTPGGSSSTSAFSYGTPASESPT